MYEKIDSISSNIGLCSCFEEDVVRMIPTKSKLLSLQEVPKEIVYQEDFVYSDEEISPIGNKITIYSGDGLGDTEVVLKPISVKEENAYEPTYLILQCLNIIMTIKKNKKKS